MEIWLGKFVWQVFFLQFCWPFFFYAFFCRVLERSTQIKDPQQKSRNSDLESETLLEAVGESWEIQTKRFEQVFGTQNDNWNFSVFPWNWFYCGKKGVLFLGLQIDFIIFFKNWIPWPRAGHVFFSCTELLRFPWIFICCVFLFWRRPSPLDMRKGNGTIAPWPAFSMAKKGLEKLMTMMVKQGPVSSVAYQNESVVKVCFNNFPRLNQSALCPKNLLQLSPGRYLSVVYGLKGWLEVLP